MQFRRPRTKLGIPRLVGIDLHGDRLVEDVLDLVDSDSRRKSPSRRVVRYRAIRVTAAAHPPGRWVPTERYGGLATMLISNGAPHPGPPPVPRGTGGSTDDRERARGSTRAGATATSRSAILTRAIAVGYRPGGTTAPVDLDGDPRGLGGSATGRTTDRSRTRTGPSRLQT
jgi:hypothetical protein